MWSCDLSCIKGLLQWQDILLESQLQGNLKTSIRNYTTAKLVYVIIRFQVQFGINLHLWVPQKAEIALAALAGAISALWKTHKCKLIPNWTRKTLWLLSNNINMKKFAWSKWRKIFLKIIFSHSRKLFFKVSTQNIRHFTWYHLLRKFPIAFQPIIIQNYDV